MYQYATKGTCSSAIQFDVDGDIVKDVRFIGGCSGNTQGVARLCEGRSVDEVIGLLEGIRCGYKATSCPDQLAQALKQYKAMKD